MNLGKNSPSQLFHEEMDPAKNPVDFKPTFNHKPVEALLKMEPDCIYGYESPVDVYIRNMVTDLQEKRDGEICAQIEEQIGVHVDKDEMMKALAYDRDQYEKGYRRGYAVGFSEGREAVETVPITATMGEKTWHGYLDKSRMLISFSPMTAELAGELGITWEEIEEQKRRAEE